MSTTDRTVTIWWGDLPHWEVENGQYFVTVRLKNSLPKQAADRIRELSRRYRAIRAGNWSEGLRLRREIFREMEHWLDRMETVRFLEQPAVAEMVMEAIAFRERRVWKMLEFVLLPNHLHLFFELLRPGLKTAMRDFTRWTGNQANKILERAGERFWQDEWFDHWSRSPEESERIAAYIRRNPVKAGLVQDHLDWAWGSWRA